MYIAGKEGTTMLDLRLCVLLSNNQYGLKRKWCSIILPSERAAYFHPLHVRLEIMRTQKPHIGYGLKPCEWGWQRANSRLVLIIADKLIAPEVLFKVIRWNFITAAKHMCDTLMYTHRKNEQIVCRRVGIVEVTHVRTICQKIK